MATSKKATSKATSKKIDLDIANEVNNEIVESLLSCFSLEAEYEVYLEIDALNASGALSVRGIQKTIEKVEEIGNAPTLKSSYAQNFPIVRKLRSELGGANESLKTLFNLAQNGRVAFGGVENLSQKISEAKDIANLKSAVEKAKEKKSRGAGKQSADEKKAAEKEKKVSAKDMAIALTLALEGGEPVAMITLQNLQKAISERLRKMSSK